MAEGLTNNGDQATVFLANAATEIDVIFLSLGNLDNVL